MSWSIQNEPQLDISLWIASNVSNYKRRQRVCIHKWKIMKFLKLGVVRFRAGMVDPFNELMRARVVTSKLNKGESFSITISQLASGYCLVTLRTFRCKFLLGQQWEKRGTGGHCDTC